MQILITGATGLIGQALAQQLARAGHALICASRSAPAPGLLPPGARHLAVDFSEAPASSWWLPHLAGVDVVVNAVGIFNEQGAQTFDALHTRAPVALFEAAARAGVQRVVQVSALGADAQAATAFHQGKFRADEALRRLPLRSAIVVQPSLVYAPHGPSAALFNQLALLPAVVLPATDAPIQPVHLQDVVDALAQLATGPISTTAAGGATTATTTLAAVGPQPLTLAAYLAQLRAALGQRGRQWVLRLPMALVAAALRLLAALRLRFINPSALAMLARGNHADAAPLARCLGRAPRPVAQFLGSDIEREQARTQALLATWLGAMKLALALVWIVTGLLSLGLYPVAQSLALLADFGLHGALAQVALYAGALIDLALGLALLATPLPAARWVLGAQMLVMLGYTALITLRIPEWWLHPFGPVLKNLPMLVATAMLMALPARPRSSAAQPPTEPR